MLEGIKIKSTSKFCENDEISEENDRCLEDVEGNKMLDYLDDK